MERMKTSFTEGKCDEEQGGASLHNSSSQLLTQDPRAQARIWSPFTGAFAAVLCVSLVAVVVVAVVAFKLLFSPAGPPAPTCPEDWIHFGGKCYLFSKAEGDWATGQKNCSSLGASLVGIHTQADLEFLMQNKSSSSYWIGLRKEPGQPWKWVDGTAFNSSLFQVGEDGRCAYLNQRPSISWCYTPMNWICSRPDRLAERHPNQALCSCRWQMPVRCLSSVRSYFPQL